MTKHHRAASLVHEGIRLLRPFWPVVLLATAMGILSGLATAWLIATINRALHADGGATAGLLAALAGLCVVAIAGEIMSDLGNSFVGQEVIAGLRKALTDRILAAPIDQIERFRMHRLTAILNQDVEVISSFTFAFSSLVIAAAITIGGFAYLLALSPAMSLVAVVAVTIGTTAHMAARNAGRRGFEAARTAQDDLQRHYRAATEGAKELRISRERRQRLRNTDLRGTIERIRDLRVCAMRIYMSANAFGSALFFVVIGALLGLQDVFHVGNEVLSGFVLVLLYVKGPLQQLVGALPLIGQAQVAFGRVAELSQAFANPEAGVLLAGHGSSRPSMRQIRLRGVRYSFPAEAGGGSFVLGPIDLTITAGEMIFIVGENGCGKTTLVKLLLGLYTPENGEILLNGEAVTAETRDDYRQLFTTVFADYYLFGDLVADEALDTDVLSYLDRLQLAHKVTVENGRFTTTDLSTGQRKRLALVHAYLEDRPVLVFDEWAADQDPTFRRVFYTELLPALKARGKTLVVISHDDQYFHLADRVLPMADGKIGEIVTHTPTRQADDRRQSLSGATP
ncbi:cyclic peptide export ABC transporter [Chelatococcus sp. GCM10030263]|uniref:cyclic peptide export ABC transporter n=1 Tax=Chelatococcus sp. GCM10030263 TaxID=3273387 RepID=UPI0036241462